MREPHIDEALSESRRVQKDVRGQLVRLEEKVNHLPSKDFIFTMAVAIVLAVAAFATFQTQIQHFLGVADHATETRTGGGE